jgi:hypothetical protein
MFPERQTAISITPSLAWLGVLEAKVPTCPRSSTYRRPQILVPLTSPSPAIEGGTLTDEAEHSEWLTKYLRDAAQAPQLSRADERHLGQLMEGVRLASRVAALRLLALSSTPVVLRVA